MRHPRQLALGKDILRNELQPTGTSRIPRITQGRLYHFSTFLNILPPFSLSFFLSFFLLIPRQRPRRSVHFSIHGRLHCLISPGPSNLSRIHFPLPLPSRGTNSYQGVKYTQYFTSDSFYQDLPNCPLKERASLPTCLPFISPSRLPATDLSPLCLGPLHLFVFNHSLLPREAVRLPNRINHHGNPILSTA